METAVQEEKTAVGDAHQGIAAIPIRAGGKIVGVVDVRRRAEAGNWSSEDIQLLESLSEQVGVALESARLFQDTQRAATRDRLMTEITARVRESLDMRTVLETAANELYEQLGLERVAIHLSAEEQGMAEPVVEPGGDNGDAA
jgi:GAF domain-containing protein